MLPKSNRLNLKIDFKWLVTGKQLETKYIKLFIKPGDNTMPRVGIAVSKKNFAKATERNRARRLTSAAIEVLYENLPKGINILALPKSGILKVKSDDIILDLKEELKKEKVI